MKEPTGEWSQVTKTLQFPASENGKNQALPQGEAAFIPCFACNHSSHLHPAQAPRRACSKAAGCHGNGSASAARLQGRWDLEIWGTQSTPLCSAPPSAYRFILLLWETRRVFVCYSARQEDRRTSTQAKVPVPTLPSPCPKPQPQ